MAEPADPLLRTLRWEHRLVVYQAGKPAEAEAVRVAAAAHEEAFADRRILFLSLGEEGQPRGDPPPLHRFLSPAAKREVRERWEIPDEGPRFLLIGLDGTVKDRREDLPVWEEWWERIDRMPLRRRELRQREGS